MTTPIPQTKSDERARVERALLNVGWVRVEGPPIRTLTAARGIIANAAKALKLTAETRTGTGHEYVIGYVRDRISDDPYVVASTLRVLLQRPPIGP